MKLGDTLRILSEVRTTTNKKVRVLAKENEKVRLVAIHGDVLIVEGRERFAIHIYNVK